MKNLAHWLTGVVPDSAYSLSVLRVLKRVVGFHPSSQAIPSLLAYDMEKLVELGFVQ